MAARDRDERDWRIGAWADRVPTTPPAATITAQGTILGTFQHGAGAAEGQPADSRTDIFAFGCVL
jgi:hypothetical protein